jgi:alkanesulfonate monooxygenase SsuD/methylene tetrahydromethanopterin reductase-like flavin-dependent oxidoreductase (luciferase family)
MKALWFHLMPYPELPEGFREDYRSVWVDIDPSLYDPAVGHRAYHDYLDELEHAAACGFDGICVNEHHSNAYGLMPSPNLMASALARSTDDAAIVVMGNSLALYNPPIRVAEEMAMIDGLSGGRLVAGFPVGTPMDTCFAYGMNPATLRERYHEAHDLVMQAWTADEPFAFNGTYTKLRYVNPWPRPMQDPHPPIWIPGGGSVETWEWCAEMDYVYSYLSYFGYKAGQATMKGFWDRMATLGREPNPFQAGFIQFVGVADTEAEARRLYREPAEYFFNRCLHLYPPFADPPGYRTEATVRAGVEGMVKQAADRVKAASGSSKPGASAGLSFDEMVDRGYVVIGTPTTVAEQLTEVATSLNVGNLMLLCQFGNMDRDLAMFNTDLVARKVLPEIRGLFTDEWEHRWWIKPMAADQRRSTTRTEVAR